MKKINVYVKDKNTLVLNEDAVKGDYIDLTELATVDTTAIEASIADAKDRVYLEKLAEFKKSLVAEAKLDKEEALAKLLSRIQELESIISKNKELNDATLKAKEQEKVDAINLKANEIEKKYLDQISELNNKLATFEANKESEITSINSKHSEFINNLNMKHTQKLQEETKKLESKENELNVLKAKYDADMKNIELELNAKYQNQISELKKNAEVEKANNENTISKLTLEHQKELDDNKHQYEDKLRNLNEKVLGLQRQRNSLTSKLIGEDLETWCSNEALSHMQMGLLNCTWTKDNVVVKDTNDVKGTKGDFIFNIYATEEHKEDELLANMLLEMKAESTTGKTKNHEHFKKLDEDRCKKHCKYAVLVSDLERENNNDLPMFRVPGYKDMYVVRPEYMMTFINMISSITMKFVDLVLNKTKEELTLKTKKEILEEFDAIKETYLNKELDALAKDIDDIEKATNSIITSASKINGSIEHIRLQYMQKIERKLETYSAKLNKTLKRIEA